MPRFRPALLSSVVLCLSLLTVVPAFARMPAEKPRADAVVSPVKPPGEPARGHGRGAGVRIRGAVGDWRAPAEAGEVLVVAKSGRVPAKERIAASVRGSGGRLGGWIEGRRNVAVVTVPKGMAREAYARRLASDPDVAWVQPNYRYRVAAWPGDSPNDPYFPMQWGLPRIGMVSAWSVTAGSSDVVVAVIDTGVDLDHPDLVGRIDTENDWDFVADDPTPDDQHGHGTHVAGIIVATTNNGECVAGVAPGCTVLPIRVLNAGGKGTTASLIAGIDWAVSKGADVINLSIGGEFWPDPLEVQAVADAYRAGSVVVAAVGNSAYGDRGWIPAYGAEYPAHAWGAVGVGATTQGDARAGFSNYGAGVDMAAPGSDVLSTMMPGSRYVSSNRWVGPYSAYLDGTSMASPHVAGVAALLRSLHPDWTAPQVVHQVLGTAEDLGAPGRDDHFGYGLVRADRALTAAQVQPGADDDIYGVPLPPSPVTGTLDPSSDEHDVFSVHLEPNERLRVSLAGPPATSFAVGVYDASAESVREVPARYGQGAYPVRAEFAAPHEGDVYVDVRTLSGSGSYEMSWTVSPPEGDDEIPGVELPPSPVTESLARFFDNDDVYRVYLYPGMTLRLTLSSAAPDFDLYVYGPEASSIFTATPKKSSAGPTSSESLEYAVSSSGWHYIGISAYAGSGDYTLTWSAGFPDDIPGVALPASPVSGSLDASDTHDVFSRALRAGDRFVLSLTGAEGTDFDLRLFGSSAVSVGGSTPVRCSATSVYPERIDYVVPADGTHYVDVARTSGSGSYELTYSVVAGTRATLSSTPKVVRYGTTTPVSGRLTRYGVGLPAKRVCFDYSRDGGKTWTYSGKSMETDAGGQFSFSASPKVKTHYRVRFLGTSTLMPSTSGSVYYTPRAYLTPAACASTVRRNKAFYVTGFLKPHHRRRGRSVVLYCYRSESGKWVLRKTSYAYNRDYSSYTQYAFDQTLPLPGKWKIVAYHKDSGHAPTEAPATYLLVK